MTSLLRRKQGKHQRPIYQFMTQEELEEAKTVIAKKAEKNGDASCYGGKINSFQRVLEKDELLTTGF